MALLAIIYGVTICFSIYHIDRILIDITGISLLIYFLTGGISAIYTIYGYGLESGLYASIRYFLTMPLVIVAFASIRDERQMELFLKFFVTIIAIGAFTVPLQFIIGPVSWFSEPSERAGLVRYASLFGSLTPIGIVAPIAFFLLLSLNMSKYGKIVLGAMLVIGMVLSLQKSAFFGFICSILVYLLIYSKKIRLKRVAFFVAGFVAVILVVMYFAMKNDLPIVTALRYMYASTGIVDDQYDRYRGVDVTVVESILHRLTELPGHSLKDLYRKTDVLGYAVGGGFDMMGSALMRENETEYIMPHNNLVDFIVVGGIYHFLAFLGILFGVVRSVRSNLRFSEGDRGRNDLYRAIYGFLILYVVNLPFTSGMNFHPNISSAFWVIVGFVGSQNLEWKRIYTPAG